MAGEGEGEGGPRVAVVGAGMAGAVAARRLAQAGLGVRVFDKGRGVGGRMATRRVEEAGQALTFDHGAPYLEARGPGLSARLADWQRRGVTAPWAGRQVGAPGMTAPVRDLLAGLPVASATTITGIARTAGGWRLADGAGAEHGPFAVLALVVPAPQAAALLASGGHALPGVERAAYAPCWTLMLAGEGGPEAPLADLDGGPLARIVREAGKPGRPPGGRLVAHAAPGWSRAHLEEPHEAVEAALLAALRERLGADLRPAYARAHRWRYAQVETALGQPCLYEPAARLGAAGDWCLGPGVEAAHDSGLALAGRILADLGLADSGLENSGAAG